MLSIIIPTCNRSAMLKDTLRSLIDGCADVQSEVEVIVVDNGSSDDTRNTVESFSAGAGFSVRYIYEACPGLHVGRNLGAQISKGEILAYLDDDVIVQKGWAASILSRFASDPAIVLVGGPCLPAWENGEKEEWIESFRCPYGKGWYIGPLSLLDYGRDVIAVPGIAINGCNYSIRKKVLIEAGGFHPDSVPVSLLKYRGDGESGVARYIDSKKELSSVFDPAVAVFHRVPRSRLTEDYFLSIAKRGSYGQAYFLFRSLWPSKLSILVKFFALWFRYFRSLTVRHLNFSEKKDFRRTFLHSGRWHEAVHFTRIMLNAGLRSWVLQPTYYLDDDCPYYDTKTGNAK